MSKYAPRIHINKYKQKCNRAGKLKISFGLFINDDTYYVFKKMKVNSLLQILFLVKTKPTTTIDIS